MQQNPLPKFFDGKSADGLGRVTIAIADDALIDARQKLSDFGQLLGILLDVLQRSLRGLASLA